MAVKTSLLGLFSYDYPSIKHSIDSKSINAKVLSRNKPYILTIRFSRKDKKISVCLTGGRGDQAIGIFCKDEVTSDLWNLLYNCIVMPDKPDGWEPTDMAMSVLPVVDKLKEDEHWLAPLLSEWWKDAACVAPVRELKPIKKKLWQV